MTHHIYDNPTPMKRNFQLPALLITAVFTLLLTGCGDEQAPTAKRGDKQVVVLKAYSTTLHDRIEALGTAEANEAVDITARASGVLEKVAFTDGQQVHKGDLIVRLDQDEEKAQLAAATAQLAEHTREIKRLETLLARKAAATRDLDERKTLAAVAASNIREIKARIADLTLRAPFDGKLGIRRVSPGALVQPGEVITTLDAIDPIKLDFTIPATQLRDINVATAVEAWADTRPDLKLSGSIKALDSHIDPVTRSILARAEIPNSDGKLIPGMLMHVTIMQHERSALMVPEESITQKGERHFLSLAGGDGKVEIRAVDIGARQNGTVEIRHGLAEGELVIVRGMGFVKPGQSVTISETWTTIRDSQFSSETN